MHPLMARPPRELHSFMMLHSRAKSMSWVSPWEHFPHQQDERTSFILLSRAFLSSQAGYHCSHMWVETGIPGPDEPGGGGPPCLRARLAFTIPGSVETKDQLEPSHSTQRGWGRYDREPNSNQTRQDQTVTQIPTPFTAPWELGF